MTRNKVMRRKCVRSPYFFFLMDSFFSRDDNDSRMKDTKNYRETSKRTKIWELKFFQHIFFFFFRRRILLNYDNWITTLQDLWLSLKERFFLNRVIKFINDYWMDFFQNFVNSTKMNVNRIKSQMKFTITEANKNPGRGRCCIHFYF